MDLKAQSTLKYLLLIGGAIIGSLVAITVLAPFSSNLQLFAINSEAKQRGSFDEFGTATLACALDEDCALGEICCSEQCIVPLCSSNSQCDDSNGCTTDECLAPQTCDSHCNYTALPCSDNDSDGYGDLGSANCSCREVDCDDSNPDIFPKATEKCGNLIDEDCDGSDLICLVCGEGSISLTGCTCGETVYWSGYCCSGVWSAGSCCVNDSDCPEDGFASETQCIGQNLFHSFKDYSCQENACVFSEDLQLVEHCKFSCFEAECKSLSGNFPSLDPSPQYPCPSNKYIEDAKSMFDNIFSGFNNGIGYTTNEQVHRLGDEAILWLGWTESNLMVALVEMFRATKDVSYLYKFIYHGDNALSWRDDYFRNEERPYGIRDYSGRIGKTWSFNQWSSNFLMVQYTQTTGNMTYPLLDFAKTVYDDPSIWNIELYDGRTMKEKADYYIERCKESVAEHDHEWVEDGSQGYYQVIDPNLDSTECVLGALNMSCGREQYNSNCTEEDEGYCTCPEGTAPVPYERTCYPINQQELLIKSVIRLYELTGEQQYWDKMQKHAQFLKNWLEYDSIKDLYLIPHNCDGLTNPGLYSGWDDASRCPQQQAAINSIESTNYFDIEVESAYMLYENNAGITETDMQRLARTFTENIFLGNYDDVVNRVDGVGVDGYARAFPGLFQLGKFDPQVYEILREFHWLKPHPGFPPHYFSVSSMLGYARVILFCNLAEP